MFDQSSSNKNESLSYQHTEPQIQRNPESRRKAYIDGSAGQGKENISDTSQLTNYLPPGEGIIIFN
jgi:hypothetical protein